MKIVTHVTHTLFCIGLTLTIWRSYECLQKYLYHNLSTKVSMVKSNETIFPTVVICPTYTESFSQR